jgi:hypothetical protein
MSPDFRADFVFVVSLALAAVHLRAVLEKQPGADPLDKIELFGLTVVISYLTWRFVEQPFRLKSLVPTRRAAFSTAGLATAVLLAGSAGGIVVSQTPSDADRAALHLENYNAYNFQPAYRYRSCFAPVGDVFDDACLALVPGKSNVLLWGDSLAAHYFHGLSKTTDPQSLNILQARQMQCMPTLNAVSQGKGSCRSLAGKYTHSSATASPTSSSCPPTGWNMPARPGSTA